MDSEEAQNEDAYDHPAGKFGAGLHAVRDAILASGEPRGQA